MKQVAIIGHLAFGLDYCDGQTVKTRMLAEVLNGHFGENAVDAIDTHGGVKTLLKAPFYALRALKGSRRVLMLPAHNSLRVNGPLLWLLRNFFPDRKLYYAVIGGWLPKFLEKRGFLEKTLKAFDGIFVETKTMEKALVSRGFTNVSVMPNAKNLAILSPEAFPAWQQAPYPLCTFSRVMREKGIEDAVSAVRTVNESLGKQMFTLDIYGPVDPAQTEWFRELEASFPAGVSYQGCVDTEKSVETLQNYFALLFPTRFFTEGIPGTLIDAYAAGLPVISARWESFFDVVDEGVTGWGYEFGSREALVNILNQVAENPQLILKQKEACLKKAENYLPQTLLSILTADWDTI